MARLSCKRNELPKATITKATKKEKSLFSVGKKECLLIVLGAIVVWAIFFNGVLLTNINKQLGDASLMVWKDKDAPTIEETVPSRPFLLVLAKNSDKIDNIEYIDSNAPLNLHKNISMECGKYPASLENFHPSIRPMLEMGTLFDPNATHNKLGHQYYRGNSSDGLLLAGFMQSCAYFNLKRFWKFADEINITRWSAHGGTAMGAYCHGSMNPWDDDLDITLANCTEIDVVFDKLGNVSDVYPEIKKRNYSSKTWIGRLLDKDWILIKGRGEYYKLKSVAEIKSRPNHDLGGMDIMCFPDLVVPEKERIAMEKSGFKDFLMSDRKLNKVQFGPTAIQLIDTDILKKYVDMRYGRKAFCDFPFDMNAFKTTEKREDHLPPRASQMEFALSTWYTPISKRKHWLQLIGKQTGLNVTQELVPNLNVVEVDNSIASTEACRMLKTQGTPIRVVNFNAERGRYWREFAELLEERNEKPDIIILNEMDIGMARSGNVHTARKLAHHLKMNYAWGLEFIELTNGNHEEQNRTRTSENALGLHGNAILSTCKIFDPIIFRDPLDEIYFSNRAHKKNAMGSEKRLGGRMSLFARTGDVGTTQHIVVGSVHKAHPSRNRQEIWEYLGFGPAPTETTNFTRGIPPRQQRGIVVGGDLESRKFCTLSGFKNLDRVQKPTTFPSDCSRNHTGNFRGDYLCGNMQIDQKDSVILPCAGANGALQLSDHSIIKISLLPNGPY